MIFDKSKVLPRISHLNRLMCSLNEAIYRLGVAPELEIGTRPMLVENFFNGSGISEVMPNYYLHACVALHNALARPELHRPLPDSTLRVLNEERAGDPIACSRACFEEIWKKTWTALSPDEQMMLALRRWNLPQSHVPLVLGVTQIDSQWFKENTPRTLGSQLRCPHMSLMSEIKRLSETDFMKASA